MPSDIRSFFGGKPAGTPAPKPTPKEEMPKKSRGRKAKVLEDSDDEEEVPKKTTPRKAAPESKCVRSCYNLYIETGRRILESDPIYHLSSCSIISMRFRDLLTAFTIGK